MITVVETDSQPKEVQEDLSFLKALLADLLENQSSPRLSHTERLRCKNGIKALRRAIDAIEMQVLA